MKNKFFLQLAIGATALMACNDNSISTEIMDQQINSIIAILDPLCKDSITSTRVVPTDKEDGHYSFSWQAKDKIAIYGQAPNSSGWGFFQLSSDGGDAAGVFSGIFKMSNETTYYSFYPPRNFTSETSPSTIILDYTGQKQTADADMTHLKNYIYYAAAQADDGRFKFKHIGALLKISVPDNYDEDCTGVTLTTSGTGKFITKGQIDLTTTTTTKAPTISPLETSSTFTIGYSHGSAEANGSVTIYAMIAPTDLSDNSLTITTNHDNSTYNKTFSFHSQTFRAGNPYSLIIDYKINGHEYVDLGLPSGLKWATCNVGAEDPIESGLYFAWGETVGQVQTSFSERSFDWANYKWCNGTFDSITKYTNYSRYGSPLDKLEMSDDAARENWGGTWRMPTDSEFQELIDNCTCSDYNFYGIKKITGPNGNYILLPTSGIFEGYNCAVYDDGYYWSSSLHENDAWANYLQLSTYSNDLRISSLERYHGMTVRPVSE